MNKKTHFIFIVCFCVLQGHMAFQVRSCILLHIRHALILFVSLMFLIVLCFRVQSPPAQQTA